MPTKKQYIITLVTAVIIFSILFTMTYMRTYQKALKNPIVTPDEVEIEAAAGVLNPILPVEEDKIETRTKITVKLIDKYKGPIGESSIEPLSLLGLTRQEIEERFKGYTVQQFSKEEVVLSKLIEVEPKVEKYVLGLKDNMIGIIAQGDKESFISLGLPAKTFSKHTIMLMINKAIEIDALQKEKLEQNPYYIEQILQGYAE